uniref:Uncharacterized protein n=1 Tax=Romanomermis culicivorax TaxID=13658 RepID=A0A915JGF9_ROMCU
MEYSYDKKSWFATNQNFYYCVYSHIHYDSQNSGKMKIDRLIGRIFCERRILIWKLYILLIILTCAGLIYHTYDFTFSVSDQFSTYVWHQRRLYFVGDGNPGALLKVHGDLLLDILNNGVSDVDSIASSATNGPFANQPTFNWCPKTDDFTYLSVDFPENATIWPDCGKIFDNDREEIKFSSQWSSPCELTNEQVANLSDDCRSMYDIFHFDPQVYTLEMKAANFTVYPLAFVILAGEKYAHQVYRLMSQIYRPWNAYCINLDDDGSADFKRAMKNLDKCFANIIMPKKFLNIKWASSTILESTMDCLQLLNDYDSALPWRYVQFVSWNDFPLRTMNEMVRIVKILNGSQDSELTRVYSLGLTSIKSLHTLHRYEKFHQDADIDEKRKNVAKPVPPGDLVVYKGSMAATLSREFVHYVFADKTARRFFDWCKSTYAPEEHYWSTLIHNRHANAPGPFPSSCLPYYEFKKKAKPFISRHQVWYHGCKGKLTSGSCVFGVGDLPALISKKELFAHKLYMKFQPAAYYCMSKLYFDRTLNSNNLGVGRNDSWLSNNFDEEFYSNLPSVRYHRMEDKSNFTC